MTAFLPHHDKCNVRRSIQLGVDRRRYQYNYSYVNPLALVSRVPINDKPTFDWITMVGDRDLTTFQNRLCMTGDEAASKGFTDSGSELRRRLAQGNATFTEILQVLSLGMDALTDVEDETQRPTSLDEYAALFHEIELPPSHKNYKDDAVFAELRIAGPNPVMLHRITRVPDHFRVTSEQFSATMTGDSLEAAAQESWLYLVDYKVLEGMDNGQIKRAEAMVTKYAYASLALLAVDKSSGALCPIATLDGRFRDQTVWMKLSEIARYWAAKEVTKIEQSGRDVKLNAPFAAPGFTARLAGKPLASPTIVSGGERVRLKEVSKAANLKAGTWLAVGTSTTVCFDLPRGMSVLRA